MGNYRDRRIDDHEIGNMNIDLYERTDRRGETRWVPTDLSTAQEQVRSGSPKFKVKLLGSWQPAEHDIFHDGYYVMPPNIFWDGFYSLPESIVQATDTIDATEMAGYFETADLYELARYINLRHLDFSKGRLTEESVSTLRSLQQLETLDLWRCRGKIAKFSEVTWTNLKSISFFSTSLRDNSFANIKGHALTEVNLDDTRLTEEGYEHLTRFRNLQALSLKGGRFRWSLIGDLPALKQLSLRLCKGGELHLENNVHLESLTLDRCKFSNDWLSTVIGPSLQALDIYDTDISVLDTRHFEKFVNLTSISLSLTKATPAILRTILQLPALEEISIQECAVLDDALRQAPCCRRLQIVNVEGTDISDETVKAVLQSPDLEELHLCSTRISDSSLQFCSGSRLRLLDLSETAVSDQGLERLGELTQLETLDLRNTGITDAFWQNLNRNAISLLSLSDTAITDVSAERISEMAQLEQLYIDGTGITDSALACFSKLKKLRRLLIVGCNVSATAVSKLQKALPYCYIDR